MSRKLTVIKNALRWPAAVLDAVCHNPLLYVTARCFPMSRNPYHDADQQPVLRKSVFACMDILGYKASVEEAHRTGTEQALLNKLYAPLSSGRNWLEDAHAPRELKELTEKDRFALKAFTDNIVIGWPVRDNAEVEFGSAFSKLAQFQFDMVLSGFFIRGALSVGEAYVDEIAVSGAALLEAYEGESTLARDPRIVLTASAVKAATAHLAHYRDPHDAPHVRDLLRDSDGQWFLNYLDRVLIAENERGPFYEEFLRHKAIVEVRLSEHKSNPPVWSKYAWVAAYHNFFCNLHSHHFNDEHKIDVELFRASPTLIA
jgi:hypothetical protein